MTRRSPLPLGQMLARATAVVALPLVACGAGLGWASSAWSQTAAESTAAPAAPAAKPATAARSRPRLVDHIVAVVNSELVTALEVEQRAARAAAEMKRQGVAVPPAPTLRGQALESLIDERTIVTYARDVGIRVDEADLDRAVAGIAAQNQLSVAQLRERMQGEGMDWKRFRANLKDQLMLERVRDREVPPRIRISDAEIDAALQEQQAKAGGEAMNVAQILIGVPEGAAAEVVAERRTRAEQVLARALAGEDFSKLARETSEGANKEAGGELGLRPLAKLPDLFVEALRPLSPGGVAPSLVQSPAGFHVLKLVDRQSSAANEVTQTHARHILLRLPEGASPSGQTTQIRRLEELRREIERGERSFEAAAKEVSEDGSAAQGGDLGWAGPGQFVPEFEAVLDKLAPGAVSAPVPTRFGVHLIQVIERRKVKVDARTQREQAANQLREARYDQAYADWVKELRMRAYVELREPPL